MIRTFDAERINYLVNHESIRPYCGGEGYLDLSAAVADTQNIFLDAEHGGLAFIWTAPRIYEVHIFLLPEGRGKWGFTFGMNARNYMAQFADMLWARVNTKHLELYTRKAGFVPCGQHTVDIGQGPVTYDLFKWEY